MHPWRSIYSLSTTWCDSHAQKFLYGLCQQHKHFWLSLAHPGWEARLILYIQSGNISHTYIIFIPLHFLLFFSYRPHLPSGGMVWPFRSKQALITPWEGIVWGTAQGIWKRPHRGTQDQEIDAARALGVMAPYGMCTAPADGVSVSTLGKCVKDGERGRWEECAAVNWSSGLTENPLFPLYFLISFLQECKKFTHVDRHELMSNLSWIWESQEKTSHDFHWKMSEKGSTVYFHFCLQNLFSNLDILNLDIYNKIYF